MINITARLIQLVALISMVLLQFSNDHANTDAITWLSCMMAGIIVLIEFCKELKS
jgi:hypothetical protein